MSSTTPKKSAAVRPALSSMAIIKRREVCRRVLFGVPDPTETDAWLNERERERNQRAKDRWNFDFEQNQPCTSNENEHDLHFEAVKSEEVPAFYHSRPARVPPAPRKSLRKRRHELDTPESSDAEPEPGPSSPAKMPVHAKPPLKHLRAQSHDLHITPRKQRRI